MNKLSLIIKREYLTRVRKKSFVILTLLMPFFMVTLSLVPLWLSTLSDGGVKNIAIIDNTGIYAPLLKSTDQFNFKIVGKAEQQDSENKLGKDLFAILQITNNLSEDPRAISLTSEKQAPMELQSLIERILNEKVTEQKLDELSTSSNVDNETIGRVRTILEDESGVILRTLRMSDDGSVKELSTEIASIIGMSFTILIYMFILLYGNMVMQAVLEEKKSRVVEVMVSSVKPVNLLIGKIIGIGLVGLTQLMAWTIMTAVLFTGVSMIIANPEQVVVMSSEINMSNFDVESLMGSVMSVNWIELILYFILFFIGGYVLYASIFAMFASAVDSEEDTGQYMTPVTLIILFAFFAGFYSASNPDGPLAFWTSLIPFTSPIVMMVRIPFGIPFWEILLSLILLYGSFLLISIVAAKIYRVGILMYGKKPSFKEMMKWATYK